MRSIPEGNYEQDERSNSRSQRFYNSEQLKKKYAEIDDADDELERGSSIGGSS
jgi:hypothetical protein